MTWSSTLSIQSFISFYFWLAIHELSQKSLFKLIDSFYYFSLNGSRKCIKIDIANACLWVCFLTAAFVTHVRGFFVAFIFLFHIALLSWQWKIRMRIKPGKVNFGFWLWSISVFWVKLLPIKISLSHIQAKKSSMDHKKWLKRCWKGQGLKSIWESNLRG